VSETPETETNTTDALEAKLRDDEFWAPRASFLTVSDRDLPIDALNLNVQGRQLAGPMQGFGQFCEKTYRIRLPHVNVTPAELITFWKENFPRMWPEGNRFFAPLTGIRPGEVGLINSPMPGGTRLSTGVMVLYADDESFTLMTPQGHVFAGWITFSSWRENDQLVVQILIQMRGGDPAFEIGLMLFGHKEEDRFWCRTLRNVAASLDSYPKVEMKREVIDPSRQWRFAGNIYYNSFIRSVLYDLSRPLRTVWRRVSG
jgi:hypothetical protein